VATYGAESWKVNRDIAEWPTILKEKSQEDCLGRITVNENW
jgi:hypothetical protein